MSCRHALSTVITPAVVATSGVSLFVAVPFAGAVAVFASVVIVGHLPRQSHAVVASSELSALLDLYTATGGAGWIDSSQWTLIATDPCDDSWFGVACDGGVPAHVTAITLSRNNLTGTLPSSLGQLSALRYVVGHVDTLVANGWAVT